MLLSRALLSDTIEPRDELGSLTKSFQCRLRHGHGKGDRLMRRTRNRRVSMIVGGIIGGMLLAPMVGVAIAEPPDQLEPIIVVGQKENTGLQTAPEAITAITADALAQNWIESAEDLNGAVPGLVIG